MFCVDIIFHVKFNSLHLNENDRIDVILHVIKMYYCNLRIVIGYVHVIMKLHVIMSLHIMNIHVIIKLHY